MPHRITSHRRTAMFAVAAATAVLAFASAGQAARGLDSEFPDVGAP